MQKGPVLPLILAAALALGGCSYRPLYGSSADSAGVSDVLASVSIPEPDTRVGQIIRNDLISSMRSGSGEERYTLTIAPTVKTTAVIDRPQPAITRQSINLSVTYELLDRRTGARLQEGRTFAQASFDISRQPFADQQAATNATERAAHEVSADLRTRIAAYFATNPQQP